jgi:hypothetical protein
MYTTAVGWKHMIGLVCAVVVLVFGVTYTTMILGYKPGTGHDPSLASAQLIQDGDLLAGNEPREMEWHQEAHRIFWFRNDKAEPVKVWLYRKSCKCTRVDACVLPDEWKALSTDENDKHKWKALSAEEKDRRADDPGLSWQTLDREDSTGLVVPGQAAVAVRMNWKGEHLGPERLSAELKTQQQGIDGAAITLEVPLNFVMPVRLSAEDNTKDSSEATEISVGTLLASDVKTAKFLFWSSTRDQFKLTGSAPENPCVTFTPPEPLSKEECEAIAKRDGHPILSAYRVTVTVRESNDAGKRLDLGPFRRGVQLHSDADTDPLRAVVAGMVRGEITVGSMEDRDRIDFKSFEAGQEKTKEMTLTTDRTGLDLEIEKVPDFLKVELEPEELPAGTAGKSWRLRVTVVPNTIIGEFPRETSTIVLKTKGDTPRRVSIPVVGNVFVK